MLWAIHLFGWISGIDLGQLGVYPRRADGLIGLLAAPLIHGSFDHLISNSLPLFFLLAGLGYFYRRERWTVIAIAFFAPSLWVWVAGRSSYHIGASGMVYALAFFVFFSGVFRRDRQAIALALAVALLYGSMVWGIFPIQPGVSWESHLFGALAGVILAYYLRGHRPPKQPYSWEEESDEDGLEDVLAPWNYKGRYLPPEGFRHPD
ncbi:MAG: rhomboid family intramembrane serine protease [Bacteroidetes bacterium]|nr:MAG: rhomboid family intramembrane serine protease [Bacteroidota bacterium]